jgi:hypothetical protein
MQSSADLRALQLQQGDHHEGTIVAVEHGDIARMQRREHRAQERRLAGSLALVGTDGRIHHAGRRQGKDRHRAGDRQAHAFLLRPRMGEFRQILGRVGHGEREAVDQFGVEILPQPRRVGTLLEFVRHFLAQFVQGIFRQLGAGLAVIARVVRGRLDPLVQAMGGDPCDGRLTGSLLAVAQDLTEKRPQDDRRGVDAVLAKQPIMAGEGRLDTLAGEEIRERQAALRHERICDLLKTATAAVRRIGYILAHEKTLPGEFAASKPGRAYFFSPSKGQNLKLSLTKQEFIRNSAPPIDQIARPFQPERSRQCHSCQEPLFGALVKTVPDTSYRPTNASGNR